MTTVRLPADMEQRLESLAKARKATKSDIIKEAIEAYLARGDSLADSYALGRDYFGRWGSGDGTLSRTYKKRLKEKIRGAGHTG